jgi:virulence-associated protein VapD
MTPRARSMRPPAPTLHRSPPRPADVSPDLPNSLPWARRMYAIAFDLDTDMLKQLYHNPSSHNAYADVRRVLEDHGFEWRQGSVYFAKDATVDPVRCVLAVQDLARQFSWFSASVRDIRMLRIEENNDLMPAVEAIRAS